MPNDPTGRALRLLSLLQSHRLWRAAELADRLGTTERTVRRDVNRLRELGYPVAAVAGHHGGYRLETGAHLPPLALDDDEAVAVAVGVRQAAAAAVDGIEEASLRALTKLEQLLPQRLRRRVSALQSNIELVRPPDREPAVDPEVLTVLAAACRDHEHVRFDHHSPDGAVTGRLARPHRLVAAGRRWYLVAWDEHRADWRTFRVDRIDRIRAVGSRFVAGQVPGGDAADFVAASIGSTTRSCEAVLIVRAPTTALAADLRWIDHTVLESGPDDCRLLVRGPDSERLALTVARLALIAAVAVLEPADMVAMVDGLARRLRATPEREDT